MNTYLQLGLGLIPGLFVALFLLFKRRAFSFFKIITVLVITVGCGSLLFFGTRAAINEISAVDPLEPGQMLSFAYALAEEEDYEDALSVIDDYSKEYGYDDECRLAVSRIDLLEADYEKAAHLYDYLCNNTGLISPDDDEYKFAMAQNRVNNSSDIVMIQYLESVGADVTEYGFTNTSYSEMVNDATTDISSFKNTLFEIIKEKYSFSSDAKDCAQAVAGITNDFAVSVENTDTDSDSDSKNNKYKKIFKEIEESAREYLTLECVNIARIKAYVLAGDFDGITEKLGKDSKYHELMIAAEMYMSGLVTKKDFSDYYQDINQSEASAVKRRINKVYHNCQKKMNKQEKKALKRRTDALGKQLSDPALVTIKSQLIEAAEKDAGKDRSKVYLEIAKIENYFGNETSTDSYISDAIYTSQDVDDYIYGEGMSLIINVLNNDEDTDTENIKNVSEYVNEVIDNSLTIHVENFVSPQIIDSSDGDYYDTYETDEYGNFVENNIDEKDNDKEDAPNFVQTTIDYVSRNKNAISIGKIDTSSFETVTARVQISSDYLTSAAEIKKALKVYDCGAEITDFTLTKIDYTGSNIILVCDVSGSMSGCFYDLSNAVITFVNDRNTEEDISISAFDDYITGTMPFGSSNDDLIAFAQNMYSGGGTDMFSAVVSCLDRFSSNGNESNVLILMTDGQDNYPKDKDTIMNEIGAVALSKGVTVYTLGLGEGVDTSYLTTIAASGNGDFVYVSDSSSLTSFYDMLHGQVYNQYEITYKAEDTITRTGRTLEISLPSENIRDIKSYSLDGSEEDESGLTADQNLSISGLNPRFVYKGLKNTNVKIKGTGFSKDSKISVKLNGNIDYSVDASFVDEETFVFEVPYSAAVDTYDVEITINGKKKILKKGFAIIEQGKEKKTAFGPYVFTSNVRYDKGYDNYTLSGNVTLNGWLHFKGDVSISGDLVNGGFINVSDYNGSYVEFDPATAKGIGSYLAGKGISLDVPSLGDFTLYNDPANIYDYSKYKVDDISVGALKVISLVQLYNPTLRLYPNSIGMYYSAGSTILPCQDTILKACGKSTDFFGFSFEGSAQITNENVGIVMEIKTDDSAAATSQAKLLDLPVHFGGKLSVKIDTFKNEYSLGANIGLPIFEDLSGIEAKIGWKGSLIPDSVKLTVKLAQGLKLSASVPVTANKFSFEVANIADAVNNRQWTKLKFTGSVDLDCAKVTDYFPKLEKFVGDLSLLSMPETQASLQFSPFSVTADAKLVALSEIELAHASLKLGNFSYSNSLVSIDGEDVKGALFSLSRGIKWDSPNKKLHVNITGTGEATMNARFTGFGYEGVADIGATWWFIDAGTKVDGRICLGIYKTHNDELQFVLAYSTQNSKGKVKGNFYYIDMNGDTSNQKGTLN